MAITSKLYILDSFALIYRAHFALHQYARTNSKGQDVGALLGFANSVVEILQKRKPSHIIAAFDSKETTWRKALYPGYKAQRQIQPEAITAAIPYVFDLLNSLGIAHITHPGYEADDIIGTIAYEKAFTHTSSAQIKTWDSWYNLALPSTSRPAGKNHPQYGTRTTYWITGVFHGLI